MADWNQRYVSTANWHARWSKDSTQVGAQLYNPETHSMLVAGFNGFPRGVNDNVPERHERPAKYDWTVHAEVNAICNASNEGIRTRGLGIALGWYPCPGCAGVIIQAGLSEVTCLEPDFDDPRWGEKFRVTHAMFSEAGMHVIYLPQEEVKAKVEVITARKPKRKAA